MTRGQDRASLSSDTPILTPLPMPDLIDPVRIQRELDRVGLGYVQDLNPNITDQLALWLNALRAQPRNLTAVNNPQAAIDKHVIEPLLGRHRLISADLPVPQGPLIDIGSGNGAPGLPFALCEPQRTASLLDSRASAASFLESVIDQMNNERLEVLNQRAEQVAHTELRDHFSLALTRAAAPPPIAMELLIPFLHLGGIAMLWTGEIGIEELENLSLAATELGAELTMLDPPHDIVVATKVHSTADRFPRTWNQIRRRPLGLSRPER